MSNSESILNSEEVDFLLAAGTPPEAAPAPKPPEAPAQERTATMRGDLDQINLSDIFQTLALTKMDGLLRVRNPVEERLVCFQNGRARLLLPQRVASRRLGQRLVQAGVLQPEQLRAALVEQNKEHRLLGELLVRSGYVTQEQIEEVATMQITEELFGLFTWRHGVFEFFKGAIDDPAVLERLDRAPEYEVNSLLLEVARRTDEWEGILAAIGNLDEIPERTDADPDQHPLTETHKVILLAADGRSSFRALTEQSLLALFDAARAARDLVGFGLLRLVSDESMADAAAALVAQDHPKQALMVVQTLRDRPGERSVPVVVAMAKVMQQCGEPSLAGSLLLETAQLQTDPSTALQLARQARALASRDPGALSFLRTTLLAHSKPDSRELEQVTVELLDALLEHDDTARVLELVADARATGTAQPAVLLREARALQQRRDTAAAIQVLLEIAAIHEQRGERARLAETYEQIVRLDRSRIDLARSARRLRAVGATRLVRYGGLLTAILLVATAGITWWRQQRFDALRAAAAADITAHIQKGQRAEARAALDRWQQELGDCDAIGDLRGQVEFADAAERKRLQAELRRVATERIAAAATLLADGDVHTAISIYAELHQQPELRDEVHDIACTRLDALLLDIEQLVKTLPPLLPPPPSAVIERRVVDETLANLRRNCRPDLLVAAARLAAPATGTPELPQFLQQRLLRLQQALTQASPLLERARLRLGEYEAASRRSDLERRLDPVFQGAIDREKALDFVGALAAYRQLEREHGGDAALKKHFRDQVERYATICRFVDAVAAATRLGDFPSAQKQYHALQLAFPEIPFARVVALPLRVDSEPRGAAVHWNGEPAGRTPCSLAYLPAQQNQLQIALPGFLGETITVTGDRLGHVKTVLTRAPTWQVPLDAAVDAAPTIDDDGRVFVVDRSGNVTARSAATGETLWKFATGDLSGLSVSPLLHGPNLLVASVDGALRALRRSDGAEVWQRPGLPTEVQPVRVGDTLYLATMERRLVAVDAITGDTATSAALPAKAIALRSAGGRLFALLDDNSLHALQAATLNPIWQKTLPPFSDGRLCCTGTQVLVGGDRRLHGFESGSGRRLFAREFDSDLVGNPVALPDRLLVPTADRLLVIDPVDGRERHHIPSQSTPWSGTPVLVGTRLLLPRRDAGVLVHDLATLELQCQIEGSRRAPPMAAAGDGVVVVYPDRRLARVEPGF